MYTLEEYLALDVLSDKTIKQLQNLQIVPDDEGKLWLYFEVLGQKKSKSEEPTIKPFKRDITNIYSKLEKTYYTYIATEMLRQGYHLVAIEGGWIVHGGTEPYQLREETCTCMSREKPCKHLIFRDWHLNYRSECNEVRRLYL